ncbi:MAG: GtrA family protein [Ardenticatenaceae bacterium]|nr:GtrA family protein [Ardenticatenaceae bacterium]
MLSTVSESVLNRASKWGINPKELKRFIKFAVVGVIGAVVDFGSFNLIRPLLLGTMASESLAVSLASSISFVAAIVSNFFWNRYWTYPDSRSKSFTAQFIQFTFVNLLGILIRAPVVWLTHGWFEGVFNWLLPSLDDKTAVLLGDNFAVAFAVGIVMFWNFFVNRYWTYNDVES